MNPLLAAVAGISMTAALFALLIAVCVGFLGIVIYWLFALLWKPQRERPRVERSEKNPVLRPDPAQWWESQAVFNPGAFVDEGKVHLFYRAMGSDGVSRIGYAWSEDGVHFYRLPYPVYDWGSGFAPPANAARRRPLSYRTDIYASGGGWGGCEDPRTVVIDDQVCMTFGVFESWQSMRMAVTTLPLSDLRAGLWQWAQRITMSPHGQTQKNWVLFPEKINGKYAILHALTPTIMIDYVDSLEDLHENPIQSNNNRSGRPGHWDAFVRGAGAPPIRTKDGWLLLYHGMDPAHPAIGYKVGAMLLDLKDPTRVLYRTDAPILEPSEWYENDWKPGVVYASGAVVFGAELIVYYGGGDKYIAAAKANLDDFLAKLTHRQRAVLEPVRP